MDTLFDALLKYFLLPPGALACSTWSITPSCVTLVLSDDVANKSCVDPLLRDEDVKFAPNNDIGRYLEEELCRIFTKRHMVMHYRREIALRTLPMCVSRTSENLSHFDRLHLLLKMFKLFARPFKSTYIHDLGNTLTLVLHNQISFREISRLQSLNNLI